MVGGGFWREREAESEIEKGGEESEGLGWWWLGWLVGGGRWSPVASQGGRPGGCIG